MRHVEKCVMFAAMDPHAPLTEEEKWAMDRDEEEGTGDGPLGEGEDLQHAKPQIT